MRRSKRPTTTGLRSPICHIPAGPLQQVPRERLIAELPQDLPDLRDGQVEGPEYFRPLSFMYVLIAARRAMGYGPVFVDDIYDRERIHGGR